MTSANLETLPREIILDYLLPNLALQDISNLSLANKSIHQLCVRLRCSPFLL